MDTIEQLRKDVDTVTEAFSEFKTKLQESDTMGVISKSKDTAKKAKETYDSLTSGQKKLAGLAVIVGGLIGYNLGKKK